MEDGAAANGERLTSNTERMAERPHRAFLLLNYADSRAQNQTRLHRYTLNQIVLEPEVRPGDRVRQQVIGIAIRLACPYSCHGTGVTAARSLRPSCRELHPYYRDPIR